MNDAKRMLMPPASTACLVVLFGFLAGCEKRPVAANGPSLEESRNAKRERRPEPPAGSEAAARPFRLSEVQSRAAASTGIYAALARRGSSSFVANIRHTPGDVSGEDLLVKYMQSGPSLSSLPFWKRSEVHEIRLSRQRIYQAGDKEAEPIRNLGPAERRQWTKAWQDRHRVELKDLKAREHELICALKPPQPGRSEVLDFLDRLRESEPLLGESDLVIIESLLPSDEELRRPETILDDQTIRLLEAHRVLGERFPQSVNRGSNTGPAGDQ